MPKGKKRQNFETRSVRHRMLRKKHQETEFGRAERELVEGLEKDVVEAVVDAGQSQTVMEVKFVKVGGVGRTVAVTALAVIVKNRELARLWKAL